MSTPTIPAARQSRGEPHTASAGDGSRSLDGHGTGDTQGFRAVEGLNVGRGQHEVDTHVLDAEAEQYIRDNRPRSDTHGGCVVAEQDPPASAIDRPTPTSAASVLADPLLLLAAEILDDLERVRIANENRLRQLTRDQTDKDGAERGFGLDTSHPDVARLAALVDGLRSAEHNAELQLARTMRSNPLGPWVGRTVGVGEKQGARLLAAIGDPYWNDAHDRPRLVSELWSYCGYGDAAAQVRQRGQKANWSADAKMRAHLIAESCVRQAASPYRAVYDAERAKYADAVHLVACRRCGPSGHPAPSGSPLSLAHQHARAMRRMCKELLRDLWREAKELHDQAVGS